MLRYSSCSHAARMRRERERVQAEADLLELDKKREALQGLLARRD